MAKPTDVAKATVERLIANGDFAGRSFTDVNVMIVDEERFINAPHDVYLQVIPLDARQPHIRSGAGLIDGQIQVSCFLRWQGERIGEDDVKITDPDKGVGPVLDAVELWLQGSYLEGLLLRHLRTVTESRYSSSSGDVPEGWIRGFRIFDFLVDGGNVTVVAKNGGGDDRGD